MTNTPAEGNHITYFAETNFRNQKVKFGIKQTDRRSHMYIIGKTGTGKSTLLETLIKQDIVSGQGVALLDPHGDLAEKILAQLPEHRKDDLIYFNVPDDSQALESPREHIPTKAAISRLGVT
jgi:ABC-type ATPase involved in cell division